MTTPLIEADDTYHRQVALCHNKNQCFIINLPIMAYFENNSDKN